jgi:PAS domain S-box-containing protein
MANRTLRVLHVEDRERDVALLTRHLARAGYELISERVETPEAMRAALEARQWDVILCDYSMPHFNALSALTLLQETGLDIPFIIISGTVGEAVAVEAMRAGAHDYLMKNNLVRLAPTIERELVEAKNRRARKRAEENLSESEDRFRTFAETASDAIITIDQHSTILFVNPVAEKIFGYTVEEMLGRQLPMLMPDYLRPKHRAGLKHYVETGQKHISWGGVELRGLHKDGGVIPLEVSFGEFQRDGRHFFTGIIRDISER